jgi:hypothetical protein
MYVSGQLDVIDLRAIRSRDSLVTQGGERCTCDAHQLVQVRQLEGGRSNARDEEPVAAPCDIAGQRADSRYVYGYVTRVAVRCHVHDGDRTVVVQLRGHCAHGRVNVNVARTDATHVRERANHADQAMTAHPEVTHVVEEHDASSRLR